MYHAMKISQRSAFLILLLRILHILVRVHLETYLRNFDVNVFRLTDSYYVFESMADTCMLNVSVSLTRMQWTLQFIMVYEGSHDIILR
jgi:hypothetical protein